MAVQVITALSSGPGTTSLAVAAGLASAGAFATSNALQHRAAGTVPASVQRALAVLAHLAHRPVWLAATCISCCALALHAIALRSGSIALVQPLMLVGVVLGVPARAALERTLPRWSEVRAVGVTVVGLAMFVVSANPRSSGAAPRTPALVAFVLGCFVAGLGALRASRRCSAGASGPQAALLGAGAGVMFGATAGLLKVISATGASGGHRLPVLLGGVVLLVPAGLLGTAMNQRAYQIAPICYSMPLVNVVDIIVAVLFGVVVLGELPGHSASRLGVQVVALGIVTLGLRLISRLRTAERRLSADRRAAPSGSRTPAGQLR